MLSNQIEKFLKTKNFKFIHLKSIPSTMDEIKKYNSHSNICVIADQQTAGIGRRGKEWISPKGNIYLSFMIKYDLKIKDHFLFTAITANSIVNFLSKYINMEVAIKWPNDIIINGKKISGILTKIEELNNEKFIIIGIGINISSSPEITDYKTCCFNDFNKEIEYEELLLDIIKSYFEQYDKILNQRHEEILNNFREKLFHKDMGANLQYPNGDIEYVIIKDINHDGSLLVKSKGSEKKIFSARIINNDIN